MKRLIVPTLLLVLLAPLARWCSAQDELDKKMVPTGTFTGQVVKSPNHDSEPNWVYVKGVKGSMRKVDVATAKVTYEASVPKKDRKAKPADGIREGARVRVTAMQEGGDWRATTVEILKADVE